MRLRDTHQPPRVMFHRHIAVVCSCQQFWLAEATISHGGSSGIYKLINGRKFDLNQERLKPSQLVPGCGRDCSFQCFPWENQLPLPSQQGMKRWCGNFAMLGFPRRPAEVLPTRENPQGQVYKRNCNRIGILNEFEFGQLFGTRLLDSFFQALHAGLNKFSQELLISQSKFRLVGKVPQHFVQKFWYWVRSFLQTAKNM